MKGGLMSADSYRIAVGADHGGVELKNAVVEALKKAGREFVDYGTHGTDSVDYADFANEVARAVNEERADRGILICTSGAGVCLPRIVSVMFGALTFIL